MKLKKDILINASILSEHNTGLGVYTYQLLENVVPKLIKKGITLDIMCKCEKFLPENCSEYAKVIGYNGVISRTIKTNLNYNSNYKIVWSTTQHGGIFSKTNQIITIHDLIPLMYPQGRMHQYLYYKFLLPIIIKKCKYIFTVSQNTKNDIITYYNVSPDKILVMYEAINYTNKKINRTDFKILEKKYSINKNKYFLIIGIHFEYKNIHAVIEAYRTSEKMKEVKIVIIGKDSGKYGDKLKKIINENKLEDKIIIMGYVGENIKETLIENSIAIIFPSLYEGFGIPILEAFEKKAAMICSNTSSLPEVGGNAVLYFDPKNCNDIKKNMELIIEHPQIKEILIERGVVQKEKFNWNDISENIVFKISDTLNWVDS